MYEFRKRVDNRSELILDSLCIYALFMGFQYTPIIEKTNEDLVHHVILYECASTDPILGEHARLVGTDCYSQTMPAAWETCLEPILAWARGSKGKLLAK